MPSAVAVVHQNGMSSASCRTSVAVTPMLWQMWWIQVVSSRPQARIHSCIGRLLSLTFLLIWRIWLAGTVCGSLAMWPKSLLQSVVNEQSFSLRGSILVQQLHWLRAPEQIQFKLVVLVYKCLHGTASSYLVPAARTWNSAQTVPSAPTLLVFWCPVQAVKYCKQDIMLAWWPRHHCTTTFVVQYKFITLYLTYTFVLNLNSSAALNILTTLVCGEANKTS